MHADNNQPNNQDTANSNTNTYKKPILQIFSTLLNLIPGNFNTIMEENTGFEIKNLFYRAGQKV